MDVGTRPTDHDFFPKGVERRRGFSNRKDYFDSTKLVINFIKTDSRWKDRPEVVEALELFDKLSELKDKLKLPKNLDVDELTRKRTSLSINSTLATCCSMSYTKM